MTVFNLLTMFVRLSLILISVMVAAGCGHDTQLADRIGKDEAAANVENAAPYQFDANNAPETPSEPDKEYPGKTIDEIFPITSNITSIDDNGRESDMTVDVEGLKVNIVDYVPRTLSHDGKIVFKFKKREPGGYWGTVVGSSHLRGVETTEIYVGVSGPRGVCCTNYSITDISNGRPKNMYHSEDFGNFRNPMEIFDGDGDGVYELMQFDSCFRYFMDDCGSCSPEPRAYFKYNKAKGQYLPVAGIAQDFVREGHQHSDKWLAEKYDELQHTGDVGLGTDIRRSALAHMVDLLFIGEERKAWRVFDKYIADPKGETRREIKKRLAGCKFYQLLKRR